jgi:hypothetical protein
MKRKTTKKMPTKRAPAKKTFYAWAKAKGACDEGLEYLRRRKADSDMWEWARGEHRDWVRRYLATVPRDYCCEFCTLVKDLAREWRTRIAPALRKAGVAV